MRILMTTDTVGGVWTYTRELVLGLLDARADVQVLLVSFGSAASDEQTTWLRGVSGRYRKRFTFESTTLPLEWQGENSKAYIYAEPLLRRIAKQFVPDVLHSNQFCFGALPLQCPKIVVAHSDVLGWARAMHGDVGLPESEWLATYRMLVTDGLMGATAVVAPTHWMMGELRRGFGSHFNGKLPHSKVIANGRSVDTPRIAKKLQAVTAGRVWDSAKGMAVLENCMSPMPVLVAGETTSPDATYDAALLRRRVLLGKLPESAMIHLFAESAVYLVTSVYEPFGLSAVEAAQCGCAIVARDIHSQREVWGDDAVYFSDADSLCVALEKLSAKEGRLHEMQSRAAVRARSQYSRGRMTAEYLRLYDEVCGKNLAGARA